MSFRVAGLLDETLYEVEVTGKASNPVVGSKRVSVLVEQYTGQTVLVTPAGPAYKVDPGNAESVLALLSAKTKVASTGDGAPKLVETPPPGTIR